MAVCRVVVVGVEVDSGRCSGCGRCVEYCPCDALSLGGGGVSLDVERCCGCLGCMAVCPSGALKLRVEWVCEG